MYALTMDQIEQVSGGDPATAAAVGFFVGWAGGEMLNAILDATWGGDIGQISGVVDGA